MTRLNVVSGKGGVGKTTYSLYLASTLMESNPNTVYINLTEEVDHSLLDKLNIKYKVFSIEDSMKTYMEKKLGSRFIAKWISEASFFKALFNLLPSLGLMITLGHILDDLNQNPELQYVLDAPATGHSLSLFQSPQTYKNVFGAGVLVEDIKKMNQFLYNEDNVEFSILSLPTELALQEGNELIQELEQLGYQNTKLLVNDCLFKNDGLSKFKGELPLFLQKKMESHFELCQKYEKQVAKALPFIASKTQLDLIMTLKETLNG